MVGEQIIFLVYERLMHEISHDSLFLKNKHNAYMYASI